MRVRVLVVDDERGIADSLQQILTASGYEAEAAYSAAEALQVASRFAPHVVISDVVMPTMSGVELACELRTKTPAITVLLLSGNAATEELLAGCRNLERVPVLAKPYAPRDLLRVIADLTRELKVA